MSWLVVALDAVIVVAVVETAPAAKDTLVIGMPTDVPIFDTHKATAWWWPTAQSSTAAET